MIQNGKIKSKGFTIVETIVVIAIFGTLMIAVCELILYFYRANAYIIEQAYATNSARKGIEVMTREIREATYSDVGAYSVSQAQLYSFIFYSDVDRDTNIEKIRYFLDGASFKRGEIQATGNPLQYQSANEVITVLSEYVRNGEQSRPIFHYYNASSTEVTDLSKITDIKLVKVNLVVNVTTVRAPGDFTLQSNSQLRNLHEY